MPRPVDERALALRVCAPKDEHEMFAPLCKRAHDGVSEDFPSPVLVAARAMRGDCQRRVEQQDPLVGPLYEVGHVPEFLGDVDERRRRLDPGRNVEREPLRLPGLVVRVLAEYHDLYLVERSAVERVEYLAGRRIHDSGPVRGLDEFGKPCEIGLLELFRENALPRILYLDFHLQ